MADESERIRAGGRAWYFIALSLSAACGGAGVPKSVDGHDRVGILADPPTSPPGFFRGTPKIARIDVAQEGTKVNGPSHETEQLEVESVREHGREGPCEVGDTYCFGASKELDIELSMCDPVNLCRAIEQVIRRDVANVRLEVSPSRGCDAASQASGSGMGIIRDVPGSQNVQLLVTQGRKSSDLAILGVIFAYELSVRFGVAETDETDAQPMTAFVEQLSAQIEADLKAVMRKDCRSLIVTIGASHSEEFSRLTDAQQKEALRLHEQHAQRVPDAAAQQVEDATVGR